MKMAVHTKEVLFQGLDIIKIHSDIDIPCTKSFRKPSNKLILDSPEWKHMKSLAVEKPSKVHEEVNKFIWIPHPKSLVFS